MARETPQAADRRNPDSIEREHRPPRGKRSRCHRLFTKMCVQPAQRASPKEPLVEIAHQHGRMRNIPLDCGQQPPHLFAPFARSQAQVRRDDAQNLLRAGFDADVERAARLVVADRQVEMRDRLEREARQLERESLAVPLAVPVAVPVAIIVPLAPGSAEVHQLDVVPCRGLAVLLREPEIALA